MARTRFIAPIDFPSFPYPLWIERELGAEGGHRLLDLVHLRDANFITLNLSINNLDAGLVNPCNFNQRFQGAAGGRQQISLYHTPGDRSTCRIGQRQGCQVGKQATLFGSGQPEIGKGVIPKQPLLKS